MMIWPLLQARRHHFSKNKELTIKEAEKNEEAATNALDSYFIKANIK
jgi:hypothetical protein